MTFYWLTIYRVMHLSAPLSWSVLESSKFMKLVKSLQELGVRQVSYMPKALFHRRQVLWCRHPDPVITT